MHARSCAVPQSLPASVDSPLLYRSETERVAFSRTFLSLDVKFHQFYRSISAFSNRLEEKHNTYRIYASQEIFFLTGFAVNSLLPFFFNLTNRKIFYSSQQKRLINI